MKQHEKGFVAISAIWYERYLECSRTCMTNEFPNSVWRFYHSLLNLDDDEMAIKKIVTEYINKTWQPKINKIVYDNTINTTDESSIDVEHRLVESQYINELFGFIIQTIQDSGVGWPTQQDIDQYFINQ
jgi:hypothetical protein